MYNSKRDQSNSSILPNQQQQQQPARRRRKKNEKWFIDRWWCVPTDKDPKHNGFDYLSNALSAPLHPEQRKRAPNLMRFFLGSVLFLIARPISHNWKGRNGFCLPMHRHTQGYRFREPFTNQTRWFINKRQETKKNTKEKTPEPLEKRRRQTVETKKKEKNQCTILGDGMLTNETKRLILTVNIDTSDYLNMYATLEVQRLKWIDGYGGKTEIKHQKNRYTCSRWKYAHKTQKKNTIRSKAYSNKWSDTECTLILWR